MNHFWRIFFWVTTPLWAWRALTGSFFLYSKKPWPASLLASLCCSLALCVSTLSAALCLLCSAYFSEGCAGVSIPPALHMVKISEGNQEPSRTGLGPWHCPGLGVGRCLSGASLWGLSALKNLFVYPRVRSGLRSWALLLSALRGPGLLPLATDKNCC